MRPVKPSYPSPEAAIRDIASAIGELNLGRVGSTGTFTMANATTSTTVTDPNAHENSVPVCVALSASVPAFYVSARTRGSFTLSHTNPGANKSLAYVLLG